MFAALMTLLVVITPIQTTYEAFGPSHHPLTLLQEQELLAEIAEREEREEREEAPDPQEGIPQIWLDLADCESGEWDANADPIPGSRRWDYGAPGAFSRPHYPFDGGLNFHPDTWTWVAELEGVLDQYPRAYQAPPSVQVQVGQRTLALQGPGAWPVCSRKVGLR